MWPSSKGTPSMLQVPLKLIRYFNTEMLFLLFFFFQISMNANHLLVRMGEGVSTSKETIRAPAMLVLLENSARKVIWMS